LSAKNLIIFPIISSAVSSRKKLRLDDYLPYRLSVAASAVSRLIARAYEDRFGLTIPQWRLLAVLADEGALTPQTLCMRSAMDKVTVMRAAQGLLRRKLINRLPNHNDGRSHRLVLTATGERMYSEVAPLALQYEATLLKGFDRAEIRKLEQSLRTLQGIAVALSKDSR
jgi:DNA-binding MarR family transcriptional regulator